MTMEPVRRLEAGLAACVGKVRVRVPSVAEGGTPATSGTRWQFPARLPTALDKAAFAVYIESSSWHSPRRVPEARESASAQRRRAGKAPEALSRWRFYR